MKYYKIIENDQLDSPVLYDQFSKIYSHTIEDYASKIEKLYGEDAPDNLPAWTRVVNIGDCSWGCIMSYGYKEVSLQDITTNEEMCYINNIIIPTNMFVHGLVEDIMMKVILGIINIPQEYIKIVKRSEVFENNVEVTFTVTLPEIQLPDKSIPVTHQTIRKRKRRRPLTNKKILLGG